MAYQALDRYPARTELPRWLVVGFISGAASVLVFHQGAAALLYALELTTRAPYSMQATSPFGLPQIWSITFWGAIWGAILAATLAVSTARACSLRHWCSALSFPRWSRGSSSRRSRASRWPRASRPWR
jgi:MFS superfamily sulfate permease-like transporter